MATTARLPTRNRGRYKSFLNYVQFLLLAGIKEMKGPGQPFWATQGAVDTAAEGEAGRHRETPIPPVPWRQTLRCSFRPWHGEEPLEWVRRDEFPGKHVRNRVVSVFLNNKGDRVVEAVFSSRIRFFNPDPIQKGLGSWLPILPEGVGLGRRSR
jgi:hypothetical protein